MNVVDTSVVVAGFASWHESHDAARRALDEGPALVAHCALEAYSVLTRLPAPHRAPAHVVAEFLAARFPGAWLALPPAAHARLLARLPDLGILGGAVYDALIAATAAHRRATLWTLDRRAEGTYRRVGVAYEAVV